MFVSLVDKESFNGSYEKDPFHFSHNDLNFIGAFIDGVCYPTIPYTPDFASSLFTREYLGLYQALNQNNTDVFCNLTMQTYKGSKTIFGFNFAADLSNGC